MAFYDDYSVDEDAFRSPIWGTFELVRNNVETLVVLNLAWALCLLPAMLAVGLWMVPLWIRLGLLFLSVLVLAVATGPFYGLVAALCRKEMITSELVRETVKTFSLPSLQRLAPLYGILGFCMMIVMLSTYVPLLLVQVAVQVIGLWLLVCAIYWGPLFVDHPYASVWFVFKHSVSLVWRYPAPTARTGLIIVLALLLGVVSIGGFFLIAPVLVAILQTYRYQELAAPKRNRDRERPSL